jgi:hypothetical protein
LDHIHSALDHIFIFWIISTLLWIIYSFFGPYPLCFGSYIRFLDYIRSALDHIFVFWTISTALDHIFVFWTISTLLWIIYLFFGSYPLCLDHISDFSSISAFLSKSHLHSPAKNSALNASILILIHTKSPANEKKLLLLRIILLNYT